MHSEKKEVTFYVGKHIMSVVLVSRLSRLTRYFVVPDFSQRESRNNMYLIPCKRQLLQTMLLYKSIDVPLML